MSTEDASKLFVAGLPESITEEVLRQLFEATGGTVVNVSLPKDRATGRPRGFGFVTLSSPDEATTARQSLDGSMQAGRSISVRPFSAEPPRRTEARSDQAPGGGGEDRTLYVGNLPYDVTQAEVERVFSDNAAGPVVRIHLPMGPDGRPRGFGFVTLPSADAATSAVVALRNVDVRGRRLTVNVAHPRGTGPGERPGGPMMDRGAPRGPSRPPDAEPRFDSTEREPMAPGMESARPVEGRRARVAPESAKKKKTKAGRRAERIEEERRRGGGGTWRKLADWDED